MQAAPLHRPRSSSARPPTSAGSSPTSASVRATPTPIASTTSPSAAPVNTDVDIVWSGALHLRGRESSGVIPCTAENYNVAGRQCISRTTGRSWPKAIELRSSCIVPGSSILPKLRASNVKWLVRFSANSHSGVARLHSLAAVLARNSQAIDVPFPRNKGCMYVFAIAIDRLTPDLPTSGAYALLAAFQGNSPVNPRRSAAVSAVHARNPTQAAASSSAAASSPVLTRRTNNMPREVRVWRGGLTIIGTPTVCLPCEAYRPPPSLKPSRVDAKAWPDFLRINRPDMVPKATLTAALNHRASYRFARFVSTSTATPSQSIFNRLVAHMESNELALKIACGDNLRTLVLLTQNVHGRGVQLVGIFAVNLNPSKRMIS